jgi:hypothetical protein
MPFQVRASPVVDGGGFIISIALLSLIRPASRPIFISALLKSNLCVLAMLVLTWTTPFQQILYELRRWRRLPPYMLTTTCPDVSVRSQYSAREAPGACPAPGPAEAFPSRRRLS